MLQQFREDVRDYPATMVLSALWVVVFVSMVWIQSRQPRGLSPTQFLLGLPGGHRFGDLTLQDLFAGEIWRTLTATFVHYGILHIGMNIYALYHLGCLVESWYGSGQFIAIYVVTGGLGNLFSGLVRHALHASATIPSGGGSVVVMGLVGLCAVVGWRARSRLGDYLRNQMVWVLGLTAAIGLILPLFGLPIIDNWGHACGALVGAAVGLGNKAMTRQMGRRGALWAGWLGATVLAASGVAQVVDNQAESLERRRLAESLEQARTRWADDERLLVRLDQVRDLYKTVVGPTVIVRGSVIRSVPRPPRPSGPTTTGAKTPVAPSAPTPGLPLDPDERLYRSVVAASLASFESLGEFFGIRGVSADYARARQLLALATVDPPTLDEAREFLERIAILRMDLVRDRDQARNETLAAQPSNPFVIATPTLPPQVRPLPIPGEPVNPRDH